MIPYGTIECTQLRETCNDRMELKQHSEATAHNCIYSLDCCVPTFRATVTNQNYNVICAPWPEAEVPVLQCSDRAIVYFNHTHTHEHARTHTCVLSYSQFIHSFLSYTSSCRTLRTGTQSKLRWWEAETQWSWGSCIRTRAAGPSEGTRSRTAPAEHKNTRSSSGIK
jgi:hypothetical protein